jgi:hypothetical protein
MSQSATPRPSAAPVMSADDFRLARNLMVDGQLRPNKVVDRRILDAMRNLPRERFAPATLAGLAYIDHQVACQPEIIGRHDRRGRRPGRGGLRHF